MSSATLQQRAGSRIGVDVGGTFTDVVLTLADGRIYVNKTTTTASDPGEAVAAGIASVLQDASLDPKHVTEVVHGTTVASNTILQKVGARTGLLTTRGFRDVLEIGRIRTPGMFDLAWRKPEPLVPRRWRLEAIERIGADAGIVTPLDESSVHDAASKFLSEGIQAVAVCFINSYVNDVHERRAAAILRECAPSLLVTASCEVLPEIKEYERTSTAVVNAYLLPAMRGYLSRLAERLSELGVTAPIQVMASNGGMVGVETARDRPVFAVGSGPAGGVAGASRLGPAIGSSDLIVFDMGGTTAKAAIVEAGEPEVGSGGGSIARIDGPDQTRRIALRFIRKDCVSHRLNSFAAASRPLCRGSAPCRAGERRWRSGPRLLRPGHQAADCDRRRQGLRWKCGEQVSSPRSHSRSWRIPANGHVRFTPESGHVRCTSRCLLWANSGTSHISSDILLVLCRF